MVTIATKSMARLGISMLLDSLAQAAQTAILQESLSNPNSSKALGRLRCSWPGWLSLIRANRCNSSRFAQRWGSILRPSWSQERTTSSGRVPASCQAQERAGCKGLAGPSGRLLVRANNHSRSSTSEVLSSCHCSRVPRSAELKPCHWTSFSFTPARSSLRRTAIGRQRRSPLKSASKSKSRLWVAP